MTELSANRLRMDLPHLFRILIIMELIALAVSTAAASVVEVLIYIVFFSSARLRKKVGLTLKQPMVIMTLVLWAMVGIGIFYSAAPLSDAFELWGSWRKCLIVPLAAAAYDTTVWKDRFLWAFILLMALASLISFASFFGEFMLYAKLETPGIILNNHATQAMFFATAAFSCIIMFVHDKTCRRWLFFPLAALFMANLVIISWGRSGYLALMVYLVLLIFWETRGRLRLVLLVVIPVCTVTALMISPVSRNIIQKGFSEMQTYETDPVKTAMGLRMVFWKNTMAILEKNEHPLWGYGTDGFKPAYAAVVEGRSGWQGEPSSDPHNQYLHILVEHGGVGLAVFILFILSFFLQKVPPPYYHLGIGIVLAWSATSLFNGHFSTFHEGRFFFIWCSVMLAAVSGDTQPTQSSGGQEKRRFNRPMTPRAPEAL